jgi:hypothetical protein
MGPSWTSPHTRRAGRPAVRDDQGGHRRADPRALAVDYGPRGIRVNAVALGSITTERYEAFLGRQEPAKAQRIEEELRLLHPVG